MKKWYESKTVWLGVLTTLSGIISLAAEYTKNDSFSSPEGAMLFAAGLVSVIVRVWFTNQAVG